MHVKTTYKGLKIGIPIGTEKNMLVYSENAKEGFYRYNASQMDSFIDVLGCSPVEACVEILLDKDAIREKKGTDDYELIREVERGRYSYKNKLISLT